jgi:hypothetical protein
MNRLKTTNFQSQPTILPKPVLMQDEKNWVRKSLDKLSYLRFFISLYF